MTNTDIPRQLTSQRIVDCLRDNDLQFFVDSHGEVGTISASRTYQFLLLGENREILIVRGHWNRAATIERANEILEVCNKWNTAMLWPKAYYRVRDDGEIHVFTEVSYDGEYGVTDTQIASLLNCGVQTGAQFFNELDTLYPDPAMVKP